MFGWKMWMAVTVTVGMLASSVWSDPAHLLRFHYAQRPLLRLSPYIAPAVPPQEPRAPHTSTNFSALTHSTTLPTDSSPTPSSSGLPSTVSSLPTTTTPGTTLGETTVSPESSATLSVSPSHHLPSKDSEYQSQSTSSTPTNGTTSSGTPFPPSPPTQTLNISESVLPGPSKSTSILGSTNGQFKDSSQAPVTDNQTIPDPIMNKTSELNWTTSGQARISSKRPLYRKPPPYRQGFIKQGQYRKGVSASTTYNKPSTTYNKPSTTYKNNIPQTPNTDAPVPGAIFPAEETNSTMKKRPYESETKKTSITSAPEVHSSKKTVDETASTEAITWFKEETLVPNETETPRFGSGEAVSGAARPSVKKTLVLEWPGERDKERSEWSWGGEALTLALIFFLLIIFVLVVGGILLWIQRQRRREREYRPMEEEESNPSLEDVSRMSRDTESESPSVWDSGHRPPISFTSPSPDIPHQPTIQEEPTDETLWTSSEDMETESPTSLLSGPTAFPTATTITMGWDSEEGEDETTSLNSDFASARLHNTLSGDSLTVPSLNSPDSRLSSHL